MRTQLIDRGVLRDVRPTCGGVRLALALVVTLGASGCAEYNLRGKIEEPEQQLIDPDDVAPPTDEEDAPGPGAGSGGADPGAGSDEPADDPADDPPDAPDDPPDEPDEPDAPDEPDEPTPGSAASSPRSVSSGDLVINELMIDPVSVTDDMGEYVELLNATGDWLEVPELRLSDDGVDDAPVVPLAGSPAVLAPGSFYVICADDDWWSNGGVDCDATVFYRTFGGGFAMSNTEDEVVLSLDGGGRLDRVVYSGGIVEPGEAIGVDPDDATTYGNDDLDNWCTQWGLLSFGDGGSPGSENDDCW